MFQSSVGNCSVHIIGFPQTNYLHAQSSFVSRTFKSMYQVFLFWFCNSTVKGWIKNKNSDPQGGNVMFLFLCLLGANNVLELAFIDQTHNHTHKKHEWCPQSIHFVCIFIYVCTLYVYCIGILMEEIKYSASWKVIVYLTNLQWILKVTINTWTFLISFHFCYTLASAFLVWVLFWVNDMKLSSVLAICKIIIKVLFWSNYNGLPVSTILLKVMQ